MSVDLAATLPTSVTLATALDQARSTLSDLIGITPAPELVAFVDRRYQQGRQTDPGRRLDAGELATTVIGDVDSTHFWIDVPGSGDVVRLMAVDYGNEEFGEPSHPHAVFSPSRTCVGVVVATSLALAVAQLARGQFVDDEIRMLRPEVHEPSQVIARTRLSAGSGDFAAQCEKYLRQFTDLNGWPRDRSMR